MKKVLHLLLPVFILCCIGYYGVKQVLYNEYSNDIGAPDKPCGVGCADVNPKTVAKRYMIVQKVVSLHYESEWQ